MKSIDRLTLGQEAEKIAWRHLEAAGLEHLVSNYRCYHGEIDLIMRDRDDIVFVEVRSRNRIDYGTAGESITHRKKAKLVKTAMHFLQKMNWLHKVNSRFDVIAIHYGKQKPTLEWFKNAFLVETR